LKDHGVDVEVSSVEEYMEYLVSIGVSTPWGIGGNVSWKKA